MYKENRKLRRGRPIGRWCRTQAIGNAVRFPRVPWKSGKAALVVSRPSFLTSIQRLGCQEKIFPFSYSISLLGSTSLRRGTWKESGELAASRGSVIGPIYTKKARKDGHGGWGSVLIYQILFSFSFFWGTPTSQLPEAELCASHRDRSGTESLAAPSGTPALGALWEAGYGLSFCSCPGRKHGLITEPRIKVPGWLSHHIEDSCPEASPDLQGTLKEWKLITRLPEFSTQHKATIASLAYHCIKINMLTIMPSQTLIKLIWEPILVTSNGLYHLRMNREIRDFTKCQGEKQTSKCV